MIHLLLLLLLYWFLDEQGFDRLHFIAGSLLFLLASALSSYIVLLDILEQKAAQDERLSHLVREILHEINLPISTIDANASMLQKTHTSPRERKRLERIRVALTRLRRLYAELAYSIKKEIRPVEKEPLDLKDLLEERVAIQRELGRNPFVLSLEQCSIEVDRIGLEQTIDNLIENAMKYAPAESPIEITLRAARLKIRDHGMGMDANQILHIYERYYQGDRSQRGEGIGLTLVKRYCDESDIGIKITSVPQEGTEVILYFEAVLQAIGLSATDTEAEH